MATVTLPTTTLRQTSQQPQFIQAGEVIPQGRLIIRGSDGRAYLADNTSPARAALIGVSESGAAAIGQWISYVPPKTRLNTSGLAAGVAYYVEGGTNEVQTLTITGTPTGGTYRLSFRGQVTASLAYNAANSAIQSALEALSTIGAGNVTVTGTGPFTVTFVGTLGDQNVPMLVLHTNALTGGTSPTVGIAETTPGAGSGQLCLFADLVTGEYAVLAGVAESATVFVFDPVFTGAVI